MTALPKPDTRFPGADCLLCIAAASLVNSSVTDAVRKWPTDELVSAQQELADILVKKGQSVVLINEPIKLDAFSDRSTKELGFAPKDFTSLKAKVGIDRLLLIDVKFLGTTRNYSAYIPNGPPIAQAEAEVYIVDLNTQKLEMFEIISGGRSAQGNWDEPPRFPGLTNAYFVTLEETKDAIKRPFLK